VSSLFQTKIGCSVSWWVCQNHCGSPQFCKSNFCKITVAHPSRTIIGQTLLRTPNYETPCPGGLRPAKKKKTVARRDFDKPT